jgi:hypothetical protein
MRPVSQLKFLISVDSTNILGAGITSGKDAFVRSFSDKPKLSEALMATIFCAEQFCSAEAALL